VGMRAAHGAPMAAPLLQYKCTCMATPLGGGGHPIPAGQRPARMESYNAVPLPASLGSAPVEEPPDAAASSSAAPQTAAQAKLAALKGRLADARKANHKAVVAEDRKEKMGEGGLKAERQQKAFEKKQQQEEAAGGPKTEAEKHLEVTADEAREKLHKADKKGKRRAEYGWDVFNNEAQYRNYKKQTRRAESDGRAATGDAVVDEGDPDPLAYGQAPPVPKERVQALVEDMHEAALRRANWSRRRTFNEDSDVTYINKRNEVYNKKIERAFDPYTAEIRANLERGTAL
jgi:pre-mRNA-splicing factor SYF2